MSKKKAIEFVEGPISTDLIASSIQSHRSKTAIGAHSIFLGQVRADLVDDKRVAGIEYSAQQILAHALMATIREDLFAHFMPSCLHVYHSLGYVPAGGICLFVFVSAVHRAAAIDACNEMVERIKKELPIWGKELFEDNSFQWKVNQ